MELPTPGKLYATLFVIFGCLVLSGLFGWAFYSAGKSKPEKAVLKQAVKTEAKQTVNAKKNAAISKQTAADKTNDAAKAEAALKEITDAAQGPARPAVHPLPAGVCFDDVGLRRYNDPLGDAEAGGGRGLPREVPAQPAAREERGAERAAEESGRVDARAARVREEPQRARGSGARSSRIAERLRQFFPEEA